MHLIPEKSYFSRAGKASLSKHKILSDRDKILSNQKQTLSIKKSESHPALSLSQINEMISSELTSLKTNKVKIDPKPVHPSPAFLSPGRKNSKNPVENPETGRYEVNYTLVQKSPIFYSMGKKVKEPAKPRNLDSFYSTNLHQFPRKLNGILFDQQTSRKDLTEGLPSPHDERFNPKNLMTTSCSKYPAVSGFDLAKKTERKEIYRNLEHSPDYSPNKEVVLPKLAKNILFKNMTDRNEVKKEKDWPKLFDINMSGTCRKTFIQELSKKTDVKSQSLSQDRE